MAAGTLAGRARPRPGPSAASRHATTGVVVALGLAFLVAGAVWDLCIGASGMSPTAVLHALAGPASSISHQIVWTIRMPRVLLAAIVGCTMAVSGVIMQGTAANPLAAPDIVGVSAGAALVGVAGTVIFTGLGGTALVLASIGGGPARLALAGVTVTAMLLALTQAVLLLHQTGTAGVFFWLVGGVNFASWQDIHTIAPWAVAGLAGAMLLARPLNILALGEDTARGLGLNVTRIRILGVLCTVCLAGSAVAVAGPVAFVGLIVPHIVRLLVGTNHLVVIPVSGLCGAALVTLADVACRYVQFPFETPTGVVTALLGTPFFIYLARSQARRTR